MIDNIPFVNDLETRISIPDRAKFYLKSLSDNLNNGIAMDLINSIPSIVEYFKN